MKNLDFFYQNKNVLKIFDVFQGNIFLVGGCIRDFYLKKKSYDFDFATPVDTDDVIKILNKKRIKFNIKSYEYGVIEVFLKDFVAEITTFRIDLKGYGRAALTKKCDTIKCDAKRRDFTVNAIYLKWDKSIIDPFNGIDDIKNKILKFIGNPVLRIKEDNLRILRYFRFLPYFNTLDRESYNACFKYKNLIKTLSGNRLKSELIKTFNDEKSYEIIKNIHQLNVFEFKNNALKNYKTLLRQEALIGQSSYLRALFILFEKYDFLSLSRIEFKHLKSLEDSFKNNLSVKMCIYLKGEKVAYDYALILNKLQEFYEFRNVKFPLSFKDVEKKTESEIIRIKFYKKLKEEWVKSDGNLTRTQMLKILVEY